MTAIILLGPIGTYHLLLTPLFFCISKSFLLSRHLFIILENMSFQLDLEKQAIAARDISQDEQLPEYELDEAVEQPGSELPWTYAYEFRRFCWILFANTLLLSYLGTMVVLFLLVTNPAEGSR
jgi:hypothetical protein